MCSIWKVTIVRQHKNCSLTGGKMTQQKSKQKRQITVEQNFTKMSHFTTWRERTELVCYQKLPKTNLTELTQPNFWNEIFWENEIFWLIFPLCVQGTYYRAYASDCPKDLIMKSVKLSNWLQVLFFSFPGPGSIPSSSWSRRVLRLTSFSPPKIRYTFQ